MDTISKLEVTGVQRNLLLKRVNAQGTTGEVGADDQQNDSMYLCLVQTGTPAQTLNLDFDTGSSDLWVWSTELDQSTQSSGSGSHNIFDSSKSSTYKKVPGST